MKGLKDKALEEADAEAINTIPLGVDENGEPIVIRNGRYGPVPQAGRGHRVAPRGPAARRAHHRPGRRDPLGAQGRRARSATTRRPGLPVFAKSGRFGPYVQLGDADTLPPDTKPKMSSLFQTMTLVHAHARRGAAAAAAAAHRRRPPRRRRGDRRRQRSLRPLREVGRRDPQPRHRGAAAHRHPRRGREGPRRAEEVRPPPGRAGAAAARSSATTRCPRSRWW